MLENIILALNSHHTKTYVNNVRKIRRNVRFIKGFIHRFVSLNQNILRILPMENNLNKFHISFSFLYSHTNLDTRMMFSSYLLLFFSRRVDFLSICKQYSFYYYNVWLWLVRSTVTSLSSEICISNTEKTPSFRKTPKTSFQKLWVRLSEFFLFRWFFLFRASCISNG